MFPCCHLPGFSSRRRLLILETLTSEMLTGVGEGGHEGGGRREVSMGVEEGMP